MNPFLLSSEFVLDRRSPDGQADPRSVLLALLDLLRTEVELDVLLRRVVDLVARAMCADRATLFVVDPVSGELVSRAAHLPELPEIRLQPGQGIAGYVAERRQPVNIPFADRHPRWDKEVDRRTGYKTVTILSVPVLGGDAEADGEAPRSDESRPLLGVLQVLNKKGGIFDDEDQALLCALATEVATALVQSRLPGRVSGRAHQRYHRVVGDSPAMRRVYEVVARAAATTATVLLRGESGTGKELLARAIHVNSQRADGPFIKIDCTAIPDGLMESELFGHEKGAFTGAERLVQGKAELAHRGTLFLDEIGDLKGSLQGKLLRLLQDREFERVGGRKTIAVDIRVVAATNRDLLALSQTGGFRADLYYRLKVVEIELPPLRERGPEDVARLAEHFVALYAQRHRKAVRGLSKEALALLQRYPFPGNIRELEHCIESAVALCEGELITPPELSLPRRASPPSSSGVWVGLSSSPNLPAIPAEAAEPAEGLLLPDGLTLAEVEGRYLARALARAQGNRSEAARALGIGRNTLLRKLQDLEVAARKPPQR